MSVFSEIAFQQNSVIEATASNSQRNGQLNRYEEFTDQKESIFSLYVPLAGWVTTSDREGRFTLNLLFPLFVPCSTILKVVSPQSAAFLSASRTPSCRYS